ncbi:MAG: peptidoglycan-binding domain-containing protein [Acidobacteriaceae bacterium]
MPLLRKYIVAAISMVMLALVFCLPASARHLRRQATAGHAKHHHSLFHHTKKSHKLRGQREIDPQRATEIQQALIREHYLSGDATGTWDKQTQAAMQKFQADNGWQTRITPDARAIIKLGLGPKQDAGEYASASHTLPSVAPSPAPSASVPPAAEHAMSTGTEN